MADLDWRSYGPDGLLIRAVEPEDAEGFWAVMDQPAVRTGTMQLPMRSKARRRAQIEKGNADTNVHQLVAEIGGEIVGTCGLYLATSPRRRHAGAIGMSVHDAHHGTGIGSALLAAVLDLADNWLNLRRVELEVYTDNAAGIALYKKFGFEVDGTHREFAYHDGVYVDAYAMSRLRG